MKKPIVILFFTIALASIKGNSQATTKSTFSIADSSAFKGKYKFENLPFEYADISVQDNKLYFVGGEYNGALMPVNDKKDAFDVNGQAVFTFMRNADNKITELKIDYNGESFIGKKEAKKN